MAVYQLGELTPRIPESAYVAEEATVIGNVAIGEHSSVWPGAVIRADNDSIRIGERVNIQEGAVLHVDPGRPLAIGDDVSIGHQAMVHGCTIGEGSLIGIQAIILNSAVIGRQCLVGAGAVITEGKVFPERSLIVGAPARVVRQLTEENLADMKRNAESYVRRQEMYKAKLRRIR
jgi:carbonic anhydrase/acetyltransferase-like protein (isoleucine patch superfamily)